MRLTQNYNGSKSHYDESHGIPCAYPIDEGCSDGGRDYFYAPCDLIIKRIYGVGNKGANTIWMQSTNKVKLANGKESIVTIRVTHPEDDDLSKYKVGQKINQYVKMFREGGDGGGNVRYGNHFHIEINTCEFSKLTNKGWIKNNKVAWTTSPNSIKPEEAFFVDKSFTTIVDTKGLKFKELSKKDIYYPKYIGKSHSFVDALKEMKIDSSFSHRTKVAHANDIKVYIGGSKQNIHLLEDLFKKGLLKKEN